MTDETGKDSGGTLFTSSRAGRRSSIPPVAWIGIPILILLGVGSWWIWFRNPEATLEPVAAAAPDTLALAEEPFVVPPLDASDAAVRILLKRVSTHPQLAAWLIPDDLIRRFVLAVVDVSRGSSPLPEMEMLIPPEPFSVDGSGAQLVVSPRSQRRYDLLAEVVASLDPLAAARVYHQLLPLFLKAYEELGVSEGPFEELLTRALDNLLAVAVPPGPLEVREAVGRYVYADPGLEGLTPAAKHLLRMGPENARLVQDKLRQIQSELDLSEEGAEADSTGMDPPSGESFPPTDRP